MSDDAQLKHRVCDQTVEVLARHLGACTPEFPGRRFVREATRGLDGLELKARVTHIADVLAGCLPAAFPKAAALIQGVTELQPEADPSPFFVYWPVATFVERHGVDHFEEAFATMHGLTRLASCEFAIRPFLTREPERSFTLLERWVDDVDPHVRRLVSEGTRPRLPWGPRLRALQADPSPSVALLDRLFTDEELYVRRSVANHLNDISKDHPDLAVATARRWSEVEHSRPDDVAWVVRHALRTLVKKGHAGALALQGFGPAEAELVSFDVHPKTLTFGEPLQLALEVKALGEGNWMLDYVVHRVLANGRLARKVFKWTRREVRAGERVVLDKEHPIRAISTRKYYDGLHRCEVLINGRSLAIRDFTLTGAQAERSARSDRR